MSLISDALKTAQRERSVHASGPGSEPLVEGFFPYVSTGGSKGGSNRSRLAAITVGAVVVIAAVAWFIVPSLKPSPKAKTSSSIVLPPRTGAPTKIVQSASPAAGSASTNNRGPTAAPIAIASDSAHAPSPLRAQPPERHAAPRTQSRDLASEPARQSRAAAAEIPAETPAATGEREISRPNYEAEAVTAFNMGDFTTARSRFESAIHFAPTASAYTNYGVTLEKLGDATGAARAYQSAIGIDANYFNAWLYRARLYNLAGDAQHAVPLFMRALDIDPGNSDVNADLAELEFRDGAFAEARRYAAVAAKGNPDNPRAQYYLAVSADTLKDRDVARRAFEEYLRTIAGQERDNGASVGYARTRLQQLKGKP